MRVADSYCNIYEDGGLGWLHQCKRRLSIKLLSGGSRLSFEENDSELTAGTTTTNQDQDARGCKDSFTS